MAGFPMRRALEKKIEELGGIEFVSSHIAEGMTIGRLAEFIECSRPMLSFWINQTEERKNAVLAARKLKAEKLAEDAMDIADFADGSSSAAVNKARLQVDTRKWMASKLDPEGYGDKSMEVNISVGDLHLQALKHMGKAIEATEVIENN
jgi:lipopolysaccharide biosynthesis regulator YciM